MFDLRTHIRDHKTGRVAHKQPYRLHIVNGVKVYERNGGFFYEGGEPAQNPISKASPVLGGNANASVSAVSNPNASNAQSPISVRAEK